MLDRRGTRARAYRRVAIAGGLGLVTLVLSGCAGQTTPTSAPAASVAPAEPSAAPTSAATIAPAASAAPQPSAAAPAAASPAASGEAVVRGAAGALDGVILCIWNMSGQGATITLRNSNAGVGSNGTSSFADGAKVCIARARSQTNSANNYEFGGSATIKSAGVADFEIRSWVENGAPDRVAYGTLIAGRIDLSGFDAPYSAWRRVALTGLPGGVSLYRGGDTSGFGQVDVHYGG